jgi:murein DD-endopeptidase MepM/ murein hydrolase activator NlpD
MENMQSKYQLPFPKDIRFEIDKPEGDYAHENYPEIRYAIDFVVPINTPVLAIKKGKIIDLKDDSDEWGIGKSFADKVNFIQIDHQDGTYSEYLHLGKGQIKVKIGDMVKTGDLLGYTGLSGCMDGPHLHLNVCKIKDRKAISIPVKFQENRF